MSAGFDAMSSQETLQTLRSFESRNVTYIEEDGSWPIVWERAKGMHVWDSEGKRYLDLTAAFGVAAAGHANPRVVSAGARQMRRLPHAMGDVHPHALKAALARKLSEITFERWSGGLTIGKTIFCNSGFEAVEAALKTAAVATRRPGVIAFAGAYHGLGYGALNATHRAHFKSRFAAQLGGFCRFVNFPTSLDQLADAEQTIRALLQAKDIGAILVEPIQARGGINIPPLPFLPLLRRLAGEAGALLILDEIYTGFGRTGQWFACEHSQTIPDLICLGKALTGGFPLSACVGKADVMDAWPASNGEAIHTSTFLGNPVGCAMALAQIEEIRSNNLVEKSAATGADLLRKLEQAASGLQPFKASARGLGLMAGLEIREPSGAPATQATLGAMKALLRRGYIALPEGEHANALCFTPPLIATRRQLAASVDQVADILSHSPA